MNAARSLRIQRTGAAIHGGRFWTLGAVLAIVGGIAASLLANRPGSDIGVPAVLIGALSVGVIVVEHQRRFDGLGPLALVAIFTLCTFSIGGPYFASHPSTVAYVRQVFDRADIVTSLWLGLAGFVLLIIGYLVNPLRAAVERIPEFPSQPRWQVPTTLLVIGWAARLELYATGGYFHSDQSASQQGALTVVVGLTANLPLLACAIAGAFYYIEQRTGVEKSPARWWFYGLLLTEAAWAIPRGSRAAILTLLLMIAVLRYYGLRKAPSPLWTAGTVAACVLVVFPVVFNYRNAAGPGGAFQSNISANLSRSLEQVGQVSLSSSANAGLAATFDRFSGITSMAAVVGSPNSRRISPGETYSWTATSFLPRAIVPNKPNPGTFGYDFAVDYGLISQKAATSLALPQQGEAVMNFGDIGVAVMALIGALYGALSHLVRRRHDDPVALGVYAAVAWAIVNDQESIVSSGLLSLVKTLVIFAGALWFARTARGAFPMGGPPTSDRAQNPTRSFEARVRSPREQPEH